VVTGAGSGIGRATARMCAQRGASVGVLDLHAEHAQAVADEIAAESSSPVVALPCDVADDEAVGRAMQRARDELGRVSGLVTAAGIFHGPDLQPIEDVSPETFFHVLAVNLGGTFSAIRHALPQLGDGGGAVVTIASTAALRGHGYGAGYTASKGGVDAFTRLVAVQGGPKGVRANCICPGGIDTPMTAGSFTTDDAKRRAARVIPLGRYGEPDDIAEVATFLLSDGARYLTGQTFAVEGGSTIS
jgi:NAD(P)-dependent dehydrogenase (short-subunit alcohol dehydrogenase family)